jgi:hypothetical protein
MHGDLQCRIYLWAIVLRVGARGQSAVSLGQQLPARYGGLRGLAQAAIPELCQHNGVGPAKAVQIKAALELSRHLMVAAPDHLARRHRQASRAQPRGSAVGGAMAPGPEHWPHSAMGFAGVGEVVRPRYMPRVGMLESPLVAKRGTFDRQEQVGLEPGSGLLSYVPLPDIPGDPRILPRPVTGNEFQIRNRDPVGVDSDDVLLHDEG